MAPTTKPPGAAATSNGVITDAPAPAVNRKKQKRRQKEAARRAATGDKHSPSGYASDDLDDPSLASPPPPPQIPGPVPGAFHSHPDPRYDQHIGGADALDHPEGENGTEIAYSDDDRLYAQDAEYADANGSALPSKKKSKKKKKKSRNAQYDDGTAYDNQDVDLHYDPHLAPQAPLQDYVRHGGPTISDEALRTVHQRMNDPIWDSSSVEEKSKIRSFWINLREDERKSLVKIEKEAVLKKMKEQQKHSCSCTVCGRKRTAIEEELEVLYDAYYEELEQYQRSGQAPPVPQPVLEAAAHAEPQHHHHHHHHHHHPHSTPAPRASRGRIIEDVTDQPEDDDADAEDDGEYSEDDYDDDELSDDDERLPVGAEDILAFGRSLQVNGGILTVADELLRNDGRKFIDMMEKLADRRMRREDRVFKPYKPSPSHLYYQQHYQGQSEEDDEEYYEDEDDYDSAGGEEEFDDDEEDDEMDAMTEQQRMQEGRRMFQIFAARMFEQRVLTAYREKVARERQDRLIAEMEEESLADIQRDAKKARDAEKKKAKKAAQKAQKAEEKAKKDAERAAAEAAQKEAESKKQDEQRRKREEQKKKRDAEKKAQEEEKQRKEAEKQRRVQEERNRQQEAERKAREAKAEEKRRKDEARQKEREEKDAREAAAREKKAQQAAAAMTAERQQEPRHSQEQLPTAVPDISKRAPVALPPGLKPTRAAPSQASPKAAPALPKAATPIRPRDSSGPNSVSDSQTPDTNSKQSTPPKSTVAPSSSQTTSANSMRGPGRQPQAGFGHPMSPSIAPPPGMPFPQQTMPYGAGVNGFSSGQQPMMPAAGMPFPPPNRPMYPQGPTMNFAHRPHPGFPTAPGMPGRGFPPPGAPGGSFPTKDMPIGSRIPSGPARDPIGHSRQPSSSFDATSSTDLNGPPPNAMPISRPAPIKRPDSTKPGDKSRGNDEDETEHFGSSALLSDALDDLPGDRRVGGAGAPGHFPPPQQFSGYDTGFNAFSGGPRHTSGFGGPPPGAGWGGGAGGWSGSGFGGGPGAAPIGRHSNSRPATVRRLACQAFMNHSQPMEVGELLRQVDKTRPPMEASISMADIKGILDTEGDANNGGGSFSIADSGPGRLFVSWAPDHGGLSHHHPHHQHHPHHHHHHRGSGFGPGEIGNPAPGSNLPAIGRHT